jgi:2-oxoglutarate ferredoxin oxidoreductase subunit alpha
MNYGQMVLEVERCVAGKCQTILVPHGGGTVHKPESICQAIKEACK